MNRLPHLAIAFWSMTCAGIFTQAAITEAEWERVFLEDAQLVQDRPLLSLGAGLAGSTDGWVLFQQKRLVGTIGFRVTWMYAKLPVDFDITAVTAVNSRWLIGGSGGELAWHGNAVGGPFATNTVTTGWRERVFPSDQQISHLASYRNRVCAVAGSSLYFSGNEGVDWQLIEDAPEPLDVEAFNGQFYFLFLESIGNVRTLSLQRTADTTTWETIWSLPLDTDEINAANLMVLKQRAYPKLSVFVRLGDGQPWAKTLLLASIDGDVWSNNGSFQSTPQASGPWKPFSYPYQLGDIPGRYYEAKGEVDIQDFDDYILYNGRLEHFADFEDRRVEQGKFYESYEVEDIPVEPRTRPETTTQWGSLATVLDKTQLLEINPDGMLSFHPISEVHPTGQSPEQLIALNGEYHMRMRVFDFWPSSTDIVLKSGDLTDWTLAEETMMAERFALIPRKRDFSVLGNQSLWLSPSTDPIPLDDSEPDRYAYFPPKDAVAHADADSAEGRVLIKLYQTGKQPTVLADFPSSEEGFYPKGMVCPDGETLVVFNFRSSTFTVIDALGSARQSEVPDMSEISNVAFANGWYTFMDSENEARRTRDFFNFEPVQMPQGQALLDVEGYEGYLYGFTAQGIFRLPMQRGYLDSILRENGWRLSSWLGWFRPVDAGTGLIEHLLLGTCHVKPQGARDYWIHTATLGWIWMYEDWNPWLYRLDDEHWYWLDHDTWPPRAWDETEGVWRGLVK